MNGLHKYAREVVAGTSGVHASGYCEAHAAKLCKHNQNETIGQRPMVLLFADASFGSGA
jgi:hypothetical protein